MGLKGFDTTQTAISFGKCGKMNAITSEANRGMEQATAIYKWNYRKMYVYLR